MTIFWLSDCTADHAALVGGKATGLGMLLRHGLQVPPGFAISTGAYREHVTHNNLSAEIERLLSDCHTFEDHQRASEAIRQLFDQSRPPPHLEDEIAAAHAQLCGTTRMPVAVRSSATAEDQADASFAGQLESFLWLLGEEQVLRHVVRCWASLFTPQAIAYRAHRGTKLTDLAMGVVVQHMVAAEAAGVMMTLEPVTGDPSAIVIEASYGLGAAVVNGEVTPDCVYVDKELLEIRSRSISSAKTVAYRFDPAVQGMRREDVPHELHGQPCITDAEVLQLAALGKRVEQAMGRPQDLEWAIGPGADGPREIVLLQARPETVWSQKVRPPL